MKASVSSYGTLGRSSPSKIPSRAPLSTMTDGKNSPERRGRPPIVGHDTNREGHDLGSTIKSRMGPPKLPQPQSQPPPKMKDLYTQFPPTPTPSHGSVGSDRSGSIVRHVEPEDVYDDNRAQRNQLPSWSTMSSGVSRPGSVLQHHQYRPSPHMPNSAGVSTNSGAGHYPSAPPPLSRNISHTSSASVLTAPSAHASTTAAASENWESYTDASADEYEDRMDRDAEDRNADARDAYFAKMRSAKRLTPDDDDDEGSGGRGGAVKRIKGGAAFELGLGIKSVAPVLRVVRDREGTVEGSEAAWTETETDDGSVF